MRVDRNHDDPWLRHWPNRSCAVLGYVHNDYRLIETYRPAPAAALECPITVFTGTEDPKLIVAQVAHLGPLGRDGEPDLQAFPGGHFYLGPQRAEVVPRWWAGWTPPASTAAPCCPHPMTPRSPIP